MKTFYLPLVFLLTFQAFAQNELSIFPNPFSEQIVAVTGPRCGDSVSLEILDMTGRSKFKVEDKNIFKADTLSFSFSMDMGIYVVVAEIGGQKIAQKIVKNSGTGQVKLRLVFAEEKLDCIDYPFNIFPNPSPDGFFTIRQPQTNLPFKVEVFTAAGNLVLRKEVVQHPVDYRLDLSRQSDGVYFIRISSAQGRVVKKLVLRP